jgi:hypothetical protein
MAKYDRPRPAAAARRAALTSAFLEEQEDDEMEEAEYQVGDLGFSCSAAGLLSDIFRLNWLRPFSWLRLLHQRAAGEDFGDCVTARAEHGSGDL